MLNKKPKKHIERKWLSRVAEYGCVVTREFHIEIHHCLGKEGKHNKHHIGRLFVLPLAFRLHHVNSGHPLNITHHRKAFIEYYGMTECEAFDKMCNDLIVDGPLPITDSEYAAIMDTRR